MDPSIAALRDALVMLSAFVIGTGIVVWMLPVGECVDCQHCRKARLERGRKKAPASQCPMCRQMISPDAAHSHEDSPE